MYILKIITYILFLIGIIFIVIDITKMSIKYPKKEIEYKYIPRTLDIDIEESANVDKIFSRMFQNAEPWIGTSRSESTKIRKLTKERIPNKNK
jgi:hypothetical protein